MSLETRISLIKGLKQMDPEAWNRFARVYRQPIYRWSLLYCFNWQTLDAEAKEIADEITTDVIASIQLTIQRYQLEQRKHEGGFRCWLRQLTINFTRGKLRAHTRNPFRGSGDSAVQELLANEPDPNEPDPAALDEELDAALESELRREAIALTLGNASDRERQVFQILLRDDKPPLGTVESLAQQFETSVPSIYKIKSRLLEKIREEYDRLAGKLDAL